MSEGVNADETEWMDIESVMLWLSLTRPEVYRQVKEAKLKLEQAEAIDPEVLGGSIYASLGSLYSKVPGWPIGFGNDKTAERYFKKALEINPQGLDINYFFAEYLIDQGKDELALEYLNRALQAPTMTDRPLADQGRRQQALKLRAALTGS